MGYVFQFTRKRIFYKKFICMPFSCEISVIQIQLTGQFLRFLSLQKSMNFKDWYLSKFCFMN